MNGFWEQVQMFFWNLLHRPSVVDYIDIAIIAVILYQLVLLTRRTRAIQVLKGVAVVVVATYLSDVIGLKTLSWLMHGILNNSAIAMLVLFQPELRRALEQLGRGTKINQHRSAAKDEGQRTVDEIRRCMLHLAKRRVGALIVIEGKTGLQDVMETGTQLDAEISAALLENIFEPNTPLHDGAVILRGERVASAACVLTLSDSNAISSSLGTRHRAGLGISETTDATVLIVSEETGIISMARGGRLTRHLDEESLEKILTGIYHRESDSPWQRAYAALKRVMGKEGETRHDE